MHLLLIAAADASSALLAALQSGRDFVLHSAPDWEAAAVLLAQQSMDALLWLADAPAAAGCAALEAVRARYPALALIVISDAKLPAPLSDPHISLPLARMIDPLAAPPLLKTAYHAFQRRILVESLRERASLFAQLPLPLLLLDANGYILRLNDTAAAMLYVGEDAIRGQHLTRYLELHGAGAASPAETCRAWLEIARGGVSVAERACYRTPGNVCSEVALMLFPYQPQPHQNFFLVILRDVTGELRYQQQLEVLSRLAQQAFQDLDLSVLLQDAVTEIQQRFNYDNVGIFMQYGEQLRLESLAGLDIPGVTIGFTMPVSLGVIGWVVRNQQASVVPDVNRDARFYRPAPTQAQSAMAIPIMVDNNTLGGLYLESQHLNAFGPSDVSTLSTFCRLLGLIIHRRNADTALAYRESVQRTLLDLAPVLLTEFDLNALLQSIIEEAVRLITIAQAGALLLLEGDTFAFRGAVGYPPELKQVRLPGNHYFVPNLQRGEIVHIAKLATQDEQRLPPETAAALRQYGHTEDIVETLAAPFLLNGQLLGYLTVDTYTPGAAFNQADENALSLFASLAAIAIYNGRLFQRERAARDLAETLQRIGATLTQTLDETAIIQRVAEQIPQLIPFHALLISLVKEEGRVVTVYSQGLLPAVEAYFRAGVALQDFPIWKDLAETGESLLLPHAPTDPRWVVMDGVYEVSVMVTPLRARGHIIGFLTLTYEQTHFYQQQHLRALQALADLLVVALSNAYLYQETRQRVNDLESMRRLGVETGARQTPADIIQVTVDYALELTQADGAAFFENDPLTHMLIQRQSSGNLAPFAGYKLPPGVGVSGRAWQTQKPVLVQDYAAFEAPVETPLATSFHSALSLPVTWQAERLGVLSVFRQSPGVPFSQNELRILRLLAQQLAATLQRANLFQALRHDRDRLAALAAIDQHIITLSETPAQVLKIILDYAVELLALSKGFILLLHDDQHYAFHCRGVHDPLALEQLLRANWLAERAMYAQHSQVVFETFPPLDSPILQQWVTAENVQAMLGIALTVRSEVVGVLVLLDHQPHLWSEEEVALGQTLARQAAIALEKALLSRELRLRLEEAEVLNSVLQAANTTLNPKEMLRITGQELAHLLQVPRVTATLLRERQTAVAEPQIQRRYTWILLPSQAESREVLLQLMLKSRRTLTFSNLPVERPELAAQLDPSMCAVLLVPLLIRGELLGVLIAESPDPRVFTPREILLAESIAAAITPALENAHLYQEMQAAHHRTEEAYAYLRRLDALKSQFIQNVSHELRTPLAIVKGYVDLALDESFGFAMEAPLQQAMNAIQTHTNNLVRLVESITTLEDAEIESFELTPQPILPVLLTALQAIRQSAARQHLEIKVDLPPELPWALLDPQRLGHALLHLLDNAVKFTPHGGQVILRAAVQENDIFCQVEDTGIGIPTEELERIFDRFYQVDGSSSRKYGGMGLGLSIVKEIITRHGGRVWAESAGLNCGCVVTLVLPIYRPPEDI